ncbi:MAG: hypothetical protein KIS66_13980 [Fimbriimonadaceae bacterium]|nr:hypothetical protein [Fimbriimonadaceae bacterium]
MKASSANRGIKDPVAIGLFLTATVLAAFGPPGLVRGGLDKTLSLGLVFPVSGFVYAWSVLRMLGKPGRQSRGLVIGIFLVLWCFGIFVSDTVSRATLRRTPDYRLLEKKEAPPSVRN